MSLEGLDRRYELTPVTGGSSLELLPVVDDVQVVEGGRGVGEAHHLL